MLQTVENSVFARSITICCEFLNFPLYTSALMSRRYQPPTRGSDKRLPMVKYGKWHVMDATQAGNCNVNTFEIPITYTATDNWFFFNAAHRDLWDWCLKFLAIKYDAQCCEHIVRNSETGLTFWKKTTFIRWKICIVRSKKILQRT